MCPNGVSHVAAQWACWLAGASAVPMPAMQRRRDEEEVAARAEDAGCDLAVAVEAQQDRVQR